MWRSEACTSSIFWTTMRSFLDLNTQLPDGRWPLQELTKEALLQQSYNPKTHGPERYIEDWVDKPVRFIKARKNKDGGYRKCRLARWEVETYQMKFPTGLVLPFAINLVVTSDWLIFLAKDELELTFLPNQVVLYNLLADMGFDLGLTKPA